MRKLSRIVLIAAMAAIVAVSFAACGKASSTTSFTFTKRPEAVPGLEYTGRPLQLVSPGAGSGGTVLYSLEKDTGYSAEIPSAINAGTYTVWYKIPAEGKTGGAGPESVSVVIKSKQITVTADSKTSVQGEALVPLTYTVEPALCAGDVLSGTLKTDANKDVPGEYEITADSLFDAGSNYETTFVSGTYTVSRSAPKLPVSVNEDRQIYTYGAADIAFAIRGTDLTGFAVEYLVGDAWQDTVPGNAGTYDVKITRPADDAHDAFDKTVPKGLSIVRADYDMSGITFEGKTFTYDKTAKSLAISGELPAGVTVSYENNGQTNAGTYTVTAKFSGDAANHNAIPDKTAKIIINRMKVTATADGKSSGQGDELLPLTYKVEPALCDGDVFSGALETTADKNVPGEYDIDPGTLSAGDNYDVLIVKGVYTVRKRTDVSIDKTKQTHTYGNAGIIFAIRGTELTGFTVRYLVDGAWTETIPENAGTYDVHITRAKDEDHFALDETITGGLIINKADYVLPVSFESQTFTYDKSEKSLAITGDLPDGVTAEITYDKTDRTNVGTINGTAKFTGDTANHNPIPDRTATLTINPLAITVTADYKSSRKGEALVKLTYRVEPALCDGDEFTGALATTADINTTGNYSITQGTLSAGDNYAICFCGAGYVVDSLTVSIDETPQTFKYGDAGMAFEIKGTELTCFKVEYFVDGAWTETAPVDAGSYDVKVSRGGDDTYHPFEKEIAGGLVIDKAAYDMTGITFADKTFTYDKTPKSLEISGDLPDGVSVSYEDNGKTNAGTYTVTAKFAVDANHNDIPDKTAVLTIAPLAVTVTAEHKSSKTGDELVELTYKVSPALCEGDEFTAGSLKTTANKDAAGTYDITADPAFDAGPNYTITFTAGTYTVDAKLVVIIDEDPQTFTYGDAGIAFSVITDTGLTGFKVEYSVDGSWTETAPVNAGTYNVHITRPEDDDHFALDKIITGGLVINKADYDMSGITFEGQTFTYDKTSRSLVIGGTLPADVSVSYENNGQTNAGEHTVTAKFSGDTVNHNAIDDKTAILKIEKKAITVTATGKFSKKGEDLVPLTYTVSPALCSGDSFTGALATTADKDVAGVYTITQGNLSAGDNYAITFIGASYTVEKLAVSIDETAQTYTYGDEDIAFKITDTTLTGFTVQYKSGSAEWSGTAPVNAGTYDVKVSRAEDGTYLAFEKEITNGLVINKASYDMSGITFEGKTVTYDRTVKSLEIAGTLPEGVSVSYENNGKTNAGEYTVTANFAGDADNYNAIESKTAILKIEKMAITITAEDKSSKKGDELVELTYTVSDELCSGDAFTAGGLVTNANKDAAGEYEITANPAFDAGSNYAITFKKGKYTVTAKSALTINEAAQTFTYGDSSIAFEIKDTALTGFTVQYLVDSAWTATAPVNAGTYDVHITRPADDTHDAFETTISGGLVIQPMPVTVTAADQTSKRGEALVPLTYTVSPALCAGDEFTGALATTADMNTVGTWDITQGSLSAGPNYAITFEKGTYTVYDKLPVSINEAAQTFTYGDSGIAFEIKDTTLTGFAVQYLVGETWQDAVPVNAGTYNVKVSRDADADHDAFEKTIEGGLVIEKASYDMTGVSFESKTVTYDKTEKSLVGTGTLPEGVSVEITYDKIDRTNVGTITGTAKFTIADPQNHNPIPDCTATLTITPKPIHVSADNKITDKGKPLAELTYTVSPALCAGDEFTAGALVTNADKDLAGEYEITADPAFDAGSNYTITFEKGTYTVFKKETASINEDPQTYTYGSPGIAFKIKDTDLTGFKVEYYVGEAWQTAVPLNAGSYDVRVTRPEDFDYAAFETTITKGLVIAKANYDMSGVTFEDQTFTFDKTSRSLAIAGTLPYDVEVSYDNNEKTNAGTYTVTAKFTGDENNYNTIADMSATLTINPLAITVTADSKSSKTGEELVPLTYKVEPALCEGDSFTAGTLKTDADNTAAAEYDITADPAFAAGDNYTITFVPGKYVIADKLTIFIDERPQTYDYGTADIAFEIKGTELTDLKVEYRSGTEDWSETAPFDIGSYDVRITRAEDTDYNAFDKTIAGGLVIGKAPAGVSPAPAALDLIYNGEPQDLVSPGTAVNGTLAYALSEEGPYTETVPQRTEAMEYAVWYKVTGDENHADTEPQMIKCGIKFPPMIDAETERTYNTRSLGTLVFLASTAPDTITLMYGEADITLTKNEDGAYAGSSNVSGDWTVSFEADGSVSVVYVYAEDSYTEMHLVLNADGTATETGSGKESYSGTGYGDEAAPVADPDGHTTYTYPVQDEYFGWNDLSFVKISDTEALLHIRNTDVYLTRSSPEGDFTGSAEMRPEEGPSYVSTFSVTEPDADCTLRFVETEDLTYTVTVQNDGSFVRKNDKKTQTTVSGEYGVYYSLRPDGASYEAAGTLNPQATLVDIESVFNGKPVTGIGASAFRAHQSLKTVFIPSSVREIGDHAFRGCQYLTGVLLPDSLSSIGAYAFDACFELREIVLPASVSQIGENAFKKQNLTIYCRAASAPEGWTHGWNGGNPRTIWNVKDTFASGEFKWYITNDNEIGLAGYIVEPSGDNISLEIPGTMVYDGTPYPVTEIAPQAFHGGPDFSSVSVPASVSRFGSDAFTDCQIGKVRITDLAAWCSASFDGPASNPVYASHNLYLDDSLISAGALAVPADITEIKDYAFAGCVNLTSVEAGETLLTVEENAFYECSLLIYLPSGVSARPAGWGKDLPVCLYSETQPEEPGDFWHYVDEVRTIWPTFGLKYVPFGPDGEAWSVSGGDCRSNFVVIPNEHEGKPVSAVAAHGFAGSGMLGLVLPGSLTEIGDGAFEGCGRVSSVTIPASVSKVGYDAFSGCEALRAVYAPDLGRWSAASFGNPGSNPLNNPYAELYAKNADGVYEKVTELSIPDGVTGIGSYAFAGFKGISVTVPASVSSAGPGAFANCPNLTEVRVADVAAWCGIDFADTSSNPLSVYNADLYAMNAESGVYEKVTALSIPEGVSEIGRYAFYGYGGETVEIPASLEKVGTDAFGNCYNMTGVHISDLAAWCAIDFADEFANPLSACSNGYMFLKGEGGEYADLNDIVIPGVTEIGRYAFVKFTGNRIAVPESLTCIGESAFKDSSLDHVAVSSLAKWCSMDFADEDANPLKAAKGRMFLDTDPDNQADFTNLEIPAGIQSICPYAFVSVTQINSVTLPEGLTTIGKAAFRGCSSMSAITVPDSVVIVGESALANTAWFNNQTPEDGIVYAGKVLYTFKGEMPANTDITPAEGTKAIADCAFAGELSEYSEDYPGSPNLESINLTGITHIGERAFLNCTGLTSLTIPATVVHIGDEAFEGCAGTLTSITVEEGSTRYSVSAGCLIETETGILMAASSGCALTGSEDNVKAIGNGAFRNCASLEKAVLPSGVTTIGDRAFMNCTGLESVEIPSTVTRIGERAFCYCENLESITFDGTYAQWTALEKGADWSRGAYNITIICTDVCVDGNGNRLAMVRTPPTPADILRDGEAHNLLTDGGTASGGTMQYRLGNEGEWSETIPSAVETGMYEVWYRAVPSDPDGVPSQADSVMCVIRSKAAGTQADVSTVGNVTTTTFYTAEGDIQVIEDAEEGTLSVPSMLEDLLLHKDGDVFKGEDGQGTNFTAGRNEDGSMYLRMENQSSSGGYTLYQDGTIESSGTDQKGRKMKYVLHPDGTEEIQAEAFTRTENEDGSVSTKFMPSDAFGDIEIVVSADGNTAHTTYYGTIQNYAMLSIENLQKNEEGNFAGTVDTGGMTLQATVILSDEDGLTISLQQESIAITFRFKPDGTLVYTDFQGTVNVLPLSGSSPADVIATGPDGNPTDQTLFQDAG